MAKMINSPYKALASLMRRSSTACSTAVDHMDASCSFEGATKARASSESSPFVAYVASSPCLSLMAPRTEGEPPQVCLSRLGLAESDAPIIGVGAGGGGRGASSENSLYSSASLPLTSPRSLAKPHCPLLL